MHLVKAVKEDIATLTLAMKIDTAILQYCDVTMEYRMFLGT
ncbi:MAG: hypothetical protein ACK5MG_04990 [Bacteroidales bacterium]